MRLKFFLVPTLDPSAAEKELNAFLARRRILRVDRELVSNQTGAYWSICVGYLDDSMAAGAASAVVKKGKVDYKEVLSPEDFTRYLDLRSLRKSLAERDGVPAYNVFTNEHLAAMLQQRLTKRSELSKLPGVGPSRLERYADSFLDKLRDLIPDAETDPRRAE